MSEPQPRTKMICERCGQFSSSRVCYKCSMGALECTENAELAELRCQLAECRELLKTIVEAAAWPQDEFWATIELFRDRIDKQIGGET